MSFEDRLRDGFQRAAASMPEVPVPWEPTITKAHRARTRRTALMAVAALLVTGGVAWSAIAFDRGASTGQDISPAGPGEGAPSEEEGSVNNDELERAVRSRVLDWVKAVSLGDARTAWSWMAPASRNYFGGYPQFEEMMPTLQEGWGAWYDGVEGEPNTDTRVMVSGGLEAGGVVTVYGQVTREGTTSFDANATPFRSTDGEVLVDPFSSKIEITPIEPAFNDEYMASELPEAFEAEVPSDVSQVNFYVDGEEPSGRDATLTEMPENPDGQPPNSVASSPAPDELEPGPHALTVAAIDGRGGIAIRIVLFTVLP